MLHFTNISLDSASNNEMLQSCSFSKTVLMLLVIFGHAIAFWSEKWIPLVPAYHCNSLGVLFSWISSIHTYGFVVISGYLFSFKLSRGGGTLTT